jgi:hypothetical protein
MKKSGIFLSISKKLGQKPYNTLWQLATKALSPIQHESNTTPQNTKTPISRVA